MGCCGSSSQPEKPVGKLRRRLSVGEVENKEGEAHDSADDERGLISELNKTNLMDMLQSAAGEGGRKWSIGSQTDSDLNRRSSFANKTVEQKGDKVDMTTQGIGYTCKKGLKPESPNQDSWSILKVEEDYSIYGVFDGHGSKGHDVSNFIKENMPKVLIRDERFKTNPAAVLTDGFRKVQNMIEAATKMSKLNATMSGSTVSVIVHSHKENKLWVAHCGDSRCCLCKRTKEGGLKALALTEDHKPNLKEEKRRIEQNGGQVIYDGFANYRVYARGAHYPGLNMSRALGDLMGHYDAGISAEPTVKEVQLQGDDEILILASDGVWEFIECQEAGDKIASFTPDKATAAAERLAKDAWDRWIQEEGGMVVDDITALVIWISGKEAPG